MVTMVMPKASPKARNLCKVLGVNQTELLEIFINQFGDALKQLIVSECGGRPTRRAIRQWLRVHTSTPRRKISHAIALTRHRQGLTQVELAKKAKCPVWMVIHIENCRYTCGPRRARKVAAALNDVYLDEMLDLYGW